MGPSVAVRRVLPLAGEVCLVYSQRMYEDANLASINAIGRAFEADSAVLLYEGPGGEHRVACSGALASQALSESVWSAYARMGPDSETVSRFGPWAPPGADGALPAWISLQLQPIGAQNGCIFLGKRKGSWSVEDEADLLAVAPVLVPLMALRRNHDAEANAHRESVATLAYNERRERNFLEGSRDMIYIANKEDVITTVNSAGLKLLGLSGKEDIEGHKLSEFAVNTWDRELFLERIYRDGYVDDFETMLMKKDGTALFCLETAHIVQDSSQGMVEIQGIIKDITERVASERELWKTNLELLETNQKLQETQMLMVQHEKLASIGQLAAGVAHEINNPLGFLSSNHRTLVKYFVGIREAWKEASQTVGDPLEEIGAKHDLSYVFSEIDAIFRESDDGFERIMSIVSNLKSFSRVDQSGEFNLYDVNEGIENTLIVAWNEIKYVAEVEKDFGALPRIKARSGEINQVILNILVNAAQAIQGQKRPKKGHIVIRTRVKADRVRIWIKDDGPGIPEEIRAKVFDPFFTTKEPGKGTGLGLSISYDIVVNKHGGALSIEPNTGGGAAFLIELLIEGPALPTQE